MGQWDRPKYISNTQIYTYKHDSVVMENKMGLQEKMTEEEQFRLGGQRILSWETTSRLRPEKWNVQGNVLEKRKTRTSLNALKGAEYACYHLSLHLLFYLETAPNNFILLLH